MSYIYHLPHSTCLYHLFGSPGLFIEQMVFLVYTSLAFSVAQVYRLRLICECISEAQPEQAFLTVPTRLKTPVFFCVQRLKLDIPETISFYSNYGSDLTGSLKMLVVHSRTALNPSTTAWNVLRPSPRHVFLFDIMSALKVTIHRSVYR